MSGVVTVDLLSRPVSTALEIVALLAAMAGAFAYFRFTYARSTIEQLKALTDALTQRVEMLEEERTELSDRLKILEAENHVLRTAITGEGRFVEMKAILDVHHAEVIKAISTLKN